jgi:hypothetical protein
MLLITQSFTVVINDSRAEYSLGACTLGSATLLGFDS